MRKKTISTIIVLLVLLVVSTMVYSMNKQKSLNPLTSTMNVVVSEKYSQEDILYIKVKTTESPYREGTVMVEDENVWNLLEVGKAYFTVISGISHNSEKNIFSAQKLVLQQVDVLE